ncbi:hypothetical protein ACIA5C_42005 [Actinoplanes sp. NPDC051343]|uniref:hypothetical protein n=1 Tax=Actinoplanes sp. NPDC051343 TaxID=3363906 RepID=UPI0037A2B2BD
MYEQMTGSHRITWSGLPPHVAAALGHALGSEIVAADSQPGGFSEGLAARIRLADGRASAVLDQHHAIGPAYCDALTLMSSASLSGIDPQGLAGRHPLTRDLDPLAVNVFLAAHAGFLLRVAGAAGPTTDPRLVTMMTRLGTASLTWLRRRW